MLDAARAQRPLRVIVVDDDADVRRQAERDLGAAGYAVQTASNGVDAFDTMWRNQAPDVLLLALALPRMDGWECLEELQEDEALAHVPVVVMAEPQQASRLPGRDVLTKPFTPSQLLAAVASHLLPA